MSRLVNDLLDASLLSSSQFSLRCGPCDIVALAEEMLEQLRPVAPYHTLVIQAPERPLIGNWDGGRLQQALGNLLDNAIKYSDEYTTITVTVRTSESKDRVYVSVHNMGASIPSADIGQLFLPYIRLPATSNRQGSGLGLLSPNQSSRHIVAYCALNPTVKTVAEKARGTTFTFELPLYGNAPASSTSK